MTELQETAAHLKASQSHVRGACVLGEVEAVKEKLIGNETEEAYGNVTHAFPQKHLLFRPFRLTGCLLSGCEDVQGARRCTARISCACK